MPGRGRGPGEAARRLPASRRCLAAALALLGAASAARPRPFGEGDAPSAAAERYLSEEFFPGATLLEPFAPEGASDDDWKVRAYPGGQHPSFASADDPGFVLDASIWIDLQDALDALEVHYQLPALEQLQSPRALFDAQGRRLAALRELRRAPVAFLLEIGQWMWPAVRVGFEQEVEGPKRLLLRTLSLRPKIFEVRNFLAKDECADVMRIGMRRGLASSGVQSASDEGKALRTSEQVWVGSSQAPLLAALDDRVAALTRVPKNHSEDLQVVKYSENQYYHSHMDWTELEQHPDQQIIWKNAHFGFQDRLATVFWYLNDVPAGGETVFPKHNQTVCAPKSRGGQDTVSCQGSSEPDPASCEAGLRIRPAAGTALLWYNFHASGRGDRNSMHGGCPVGAGYTKWSANKWVNIKPTGAKSNWMSKHPALSRHGWAGETSNNACQITFTNEAFEEVAIMWKNPNTGDLTELSRVPPRSVVTQNSYRGHKFLLQGRTRRTREVWCEPPLISFVLQGDFDLWVQKDMDEL